MWGGKEERQEIYTYNSHHSMYNKLAQLTKWVVKHQNFAAHSLKGDGWEIRCQVIATYIFHVPDIFILSFPTTTSTDCVASITFHHQGKQTTLRKIYWVTSDVVHVLIYTSKIIFVFTFPPFHHTIQDVMFGVWEIEWTTLDYIITSKSPWFLLLINQFYVNLRKKRKKTKKSSQLFSIYVFVFWF